MFVGVRSVVASCAAGLFFAALPFSSFAQSTDSSAASGLNLPISSDAAPGASVPQGMVAGMVAAVDMPDAPSAQQPAQTETGQGGSSSAQSQPAQSGSEQSKHDQAEQQIKQQERQRVLGILPTFNITYLGSSTVSLTAKQKINLAFHSVTDPVAFVIPFFVAGAHEATDSDKGFPWGIKGLGERAGAAYLDAFDGNMLGNGILPAILHQDPRYYRLGHGSTTHRLLYSLATNVAAHHDKTGKWEPNYSNIGGNIIGGALSNLYYPDSDSGIGLTISNGFIVTAEGAVGSVFNEFWPDVSRKLFHKDPTHGLDAQVRAADEAKKQNKNQAQPSN